MNRMLYGPAARAFAVPDVVVGLDVTAALLATPAPRPNAAPPAVRRKARREVDSFDR